MIKILKNIFKRKSKYCLTYGEHTILCSLMNTGTKSFSLEFECKDIKEPNGIKIHFENIEELRDVCNYIIGLAEELKG